MKIIVTGTRGIPNILGGIETHCEELFPRIAAHGCDVTLIRRKSYTQDSLTEYQGVQLIDIKTPRKKSLETIIHTVKAVWKAARLRADVVHIHATGPAIAVPFARLLGLKVVFTHHGFDYNREKWGKFARLMLKFGERMGCMFANEVIVISEVINQVLKRKYNRNDAHLIYNGVSTPNFIQSTAYLDELGVIPKKYIFAMGRFVPEKNFHQLINTFSSLKDRQDCRFVLAGDADFEDNYSRDLKALARQNDVILTGFIKGEKLHALLTHARVFVLPSSHEGLPISLLEAMSYHLPVIASDIPANLEVGLPEDSYFGVGNEKQLAEKLRQVISGEPQRIKYAMEIYQWDRIAEQTIDIYKRLSE
jgi:glycosyltransferase involved in cell wall biosynthesis